MKKPEEYQDLRTEFERLWKTSVSSKYFEKSRQDLTSPLKLIVTKIVLLKTVKILIWHRHLGT